MRSSLDLSLYLVTDTVLCGDVGVPATVAAAVAAGVTAVQVRDHQATDAEFVALCRAIDAALDDRPERRIPLLIDDRAHLVGPANADGVHVGQNDLHPVAARRVVGPGAVVGLSVGTLAHVEAARELPDGVIDYLGVGPVWAQSTKPDAAPPCGLGALGAISQASPWPCVAIGGITADRAHDVRERGAAGVAVVSAICGQPSPASVAEATQVLRRAWDDAGPPGKDGLRWA